MKGADGSLNFEKVDLCLAINCSVYNSCQRIFSLPEEVSVETNLYYNENIDYSGVSVCSAGSSYCNHGAYIRGGIDLYNVVRYSGVMVPNLNTCPFCPSLASRMSTAEPAYSRLQGSKECCLLEIETQRNKSKGN